MQYNRYNNMCRTVDVTHTCGYFRSLTTLYYKSSINFFSVSLLLVATNIICYRHNILFATILFFVQT